MRRLVSCSLAWLLAAMLAWTTSPAILGQAFDSDPAADSPKPPRRRRPGRSTMSPDSVHWKRDSTANGSATGRARSRCIARPLEHWPSRTEFSRRLRLCELHFKLVRRYQDESFRNVLLRLPRDQALDLYDEVLERIETHYVDPVPLEPLIRHGLDNLEVALRDPVFLQTNVGTAAPERVAWLRDQLRGRCAGQLCGARPDGGHPGRPSPPATSPARPSAWRPTPVMLEFTCGACDALDDYTSYLTPDKLDDLYAMIDGNFVGLGIELKIDPRACGWSA